MSNANNNLAAIESVGVYSGPRDSEGRKAYTAACLSFDAKVKALMATGLTMDQAFAAARGK